MFDSKTQQKSAQNLALNNNSTFGSFASDVHVSVVSVTLFTANLFWT